MTNPGTTSNLYVGRVKWFNNKTGYGFITVTDGDRSGTDVFAHHSSITVSKEQYRYLVQGEYVNLTINRVTEGPHEFQAGVITGINGGQLMCETLNETHRQIRTVRPRTTNPENVPESTPDEEGWQTKSYKKALNVAPTTPTKNPNWNPNSDSKRAPRKSSQKPQQTKNTKQSNKR